MTSVQEWADQNRELPWIRFDYICTCGSQNSLALNPSVDAVARICDGCDSAQRLTVDNAALALKCGARTALLGIRFSDGTSIDLMDFHLHGYRPAVKLEALMLMLELPPMCLAGGEG